MTGTSMRKSIKKRVLRHLIRNKRASSRGRDTPAAGIVPGPVRRLVARLLTAAVPKNASGNNASVR